MNKKKTGGVRDTVTTVIYAGLIALAVRTFAYEPFNIPSSSMLPTLLVGDYLFVSKLSYGYSRHSFPLSMSLFSGRLFFTEPERGATADAQLRGPLPLRRRAGTALLPEVGHREIRRDGRPRPGVCERRSGHL